MADWEVEMERRQAARLALLRDRAETGSYVARLAAEQRRGVVGSLPAAPARSATARPLSEDDQDLAAGLVFAVRDRRREAFELEHKARRTRAERELASRERLHSTYRDLYGLDEADRLMSS
ncbi:hypothetical protein [Streptomyces phaeochromogenes]